MKKHPHPPAYSPIFYYLCKQVTAVMEKRLLFLVSLIVLCVLPGHAVLKEANLDTTLHILRAELINYHLELEQQSKDMEEQQQTVVEELTTITNLADQNAVMLYSQRNGYIFDLAYACHEATEQFHRFKSKSQPFRDRINQNTTELARFDSLIANLNSMEPLFLSEKARIDRSVCLALAINIRRQLKENQVLLDTYIGYYNRSEEKLKTLNDFANMKYEEIQTNIFKNGSDNYFKILSHLKTNLSKTGESVAEKYKPLRSERVSQWDVRVIFFHADCRLRLAIGHHQPYHHPDHRHPTDETQQVCQDAGFLYGQAHLHHHGHDGGDLCHYSGSDPYCGQPELYHHGQQSAGGICLVVGSHSHISAVACE